MNFHDALKLIKQFGGYIYRNSQPNYILHFNIEHNKLCTNNSDHKINPALLFEDISANDWVVDMLGCWKDQELT